MKERSLLRNKDGSIIVLAMIMLALLTLLGISATTTSTIEVQTAANERQSVEDFYIAEAGVHIALETSSTWMTDVFLTAGDTVASYTGNVDMDSDGTNDAIIEIRCIESTGTSISGLSTAANNLPLQSHTDPPPAGSGYSLKSFEIRRYGITASPTNGNAQIQIGAYKVFNKY